MSFFCIHASMIVEHIVGLGGGTQVRYYQPRLYTINKQAKVFGIDSLKRLRLYMESMVPSPDSITRISLQLIKMTPTSRTSFRQLFNAVVADNLIEKGKGLVEV